MNAMNDRIRQVAAEMATADAAKIERACEAAVQGGECGVLVVRDRGRVISAAPDRQVPYGTIHEVPASGLTNYREQG